MDQDPLGTDVGVHPGDIVLDGDRPPPTFWPTFLWHGRSPISATAQLFLKITLVEHLTRYISPGAAAPKQSSE